MEASSGTSLADWSKAWLETAGPNTLRCDFEADPGGAFTSFAVLQEAPPQHPTLRPHRLAVGLYARGGGQLGLVRREEIDIAGPRTEVPQLAGAARPDLIVLNDGDLDYAIVRFDQRSIKTLAEAIGAVTDPLARAVCWNAVIDMVRQAELPLPDFVRMVAGGIGQESVPVLQVLSSVTDQMMTLTGDPRWVAQGKQELAAAATRLLLAAEPGSDHQLAWAQLLSWTATTPDQLDLLAALRDGGAGVPGLAVDAELRWAILRRLATMGRAGDGQIDAELQRDPTDAGRRHWAACRAAIGDAEHKAAAWQLLTETNDLGTQGIAEVARGLMQPEHAGLLGPYVQRYFDVLPGIWSSRSEHARARLSEQLFPYPASSPDLVAQIDAFLAARARDPGLVRVLTERRDIVTAALRSRSLAPLS